MPALEVSARESLEQRSESAPRSIIIDSTGGRLRVPGGTFGRDGASRERG